ncbi:MAG: MFS transporter [Flavobacteriaceae bacterium]
MRSAIAPIAALLVSVFVLLVGNGLHNTLVSVRANDAQFGALILGLMGSGYFIGMTAGCLIAPAMIRRVGHIRAFAACTAIATVTPLLHALFVLPPVWILLRALTGMLFAVLYAVIESWLNDKASNEQRGSILGIYMVVNYAGSAVGQQGMSIPDGSGFVLYLIAAIMVSLSAVPVAMTRSVSPPIPEAPRIDPGWLYRLSPVAFIACIVSGLVNSSFWTLAPVFIAGTGHDTFVVANFMTIVVFGSVVAIWPVGLLSDRTDRRHILLASGMFSIAASIALAIFSDRDPTWLYAAGFCFGAATMPVYSLATAHANDHAGSGEAVRVATGVLLLYCFGAMVGPLFASGAMALAGPSGMFVYCAAIMIGLMVWTGYRLMQRKAPPQSERDTYVALRPTSPAMVGLDPRLPPTDDD